MSHPTNMKNEALLTFWLENSRGIFTSYLSILKSFLPLLFVYGVLEYVQTIRESSISKKANCTQPILETRECCFTFGAQRIIKACTKTTFSWYVANKATTKCVSWEDFHMKFFFTCRHSWTASCSMAVVGSSWAIWKCNLDLGTWLECDSHLLGLFNQLGKRALSCSHQCMVL